MLLLFWNQKTVGRSLDLPIAFLREKDGAGKIFFGGKNKRRSKKDIRRSLEPREKNERKIKIKKEIIRDNRKKS